MATMVNYEEKQNSEQRNRRERISGQWHRPDPQNDQRKLFQTKKRHSHTGIRNPTR